MSDFKEYAASFGFTHEGAIFYLRASDYIDSFVYMCSKTIIITSYSTQDAHNFIMPLFFILHTPFAHAQSYFDNPNGSDLHIHLKTKDWIMMHLVREGGETTTIKD
jgi:hypothetical protein